MSRDPRPVIAVGIDVAGPEQVESLLRGGRLPTLEALRRRGGFARVQSVTELSSGLIWPTFFTGVDPGRHGQFFTHMQLRSGTYRIEKKYADDVPCEPFWRELERAGRRVGVVDVPQTRPLPGTRGVQLVGWGAEYPAWKRSSSPPGLMADVVRRFGAHPLADQYRLSIAPRDEADIRRVTAALLHGARTKGRISEALLREHDPDFFLTVFPETHWAMHLLYQLQDPEHPEHDPEQAARHGDFFPALFAAVDEAIGALVGLRPDARVLVFSLSGMGGNYAAWHLLPELLDRLGVGPGAGQADGADGGSPLGWLLPIRRWGASRVRGVEDALSLGLIQAAKRATPTRLWDTATRWLLHAGSGWRHSRAFCVPNDYTGAIRINLRGREPQGRVEPGAEYDALCDEISAALRELVCPHTGKPIVRDVVRVREVCRGPHLDALPDLVVLWTSHAPVDAAVSPRVGRLERPFPERRTGAHRAEGFLVAAGPGIDSTSLPEAVHTLDLAPTLLRLCDVAPPAHLDGRVALRLAGDGPPA